jgi:hypothetical protein
VSDVPEPAPENPQTPLSDGEQPRSGSARLARRIVIWIVVGGVGIVLIVTGTVGILTKAR